MASRAWMLAALLAAAPCGAAGLGTLFHTPEERAQLDRLRRGEPAEAAPEPGEARTPVVTGYVRRSDGRHTVWVDGAPLATRNDPRTFDPRTLPQRAPASAGDKGAAAAASGEAKPPASGEAKPAASDTKPAPGSLPAPPKS